MTEAQKEQSPMDKAMASLSRAIKLQEERIKVLEERLSSVSSPPVPTVQADPSEVCPEGPGDSELVLLVKDADNRIDRLTGILDELMSKLEI
jgi:hypothetical protein